MRNLPLHILALLILMAQLGGCVWLPISSGDDSEIREELSDTELTSLLGQSIDRIKSKLTIEPHWKVSEGGHVHLIYSSDSGFGLFIGGGVYTAVVGFIGDQTKCYRLSFDQEGRLYRFDHKVSTDLVGINDAVDCRPIFWTPAQLAEIRAAQELKAAQGEVGAMLVMVADYEDNEYLRKLIDRAITEDDLELAKQIAIDLRDYEAVIRLAEKRSDGELAKTVAKEPGNFKKATSFVIKNEDLSSAKWIANETKDFAWLSKHALKEDDLDLAIWIAKESGNYEVLSVLTEVDDNPVALLNMSLERSPNAPWPPHPSKFADTIEEAADFEEPEQLLSFYYQQADPDPLLWLCIASDRELPVAQHRLAEMYWFGELELRKNDLLAYQWYRLASENGSHSAKLALESLLNSSSTRNLMLGEALYKIRIPGTCWEEVTVMRNPTADSPESE